MKLNYTILDPKSWKPGSQSLVLSAYETYKLVWEQTFTEIKGSQAKIPSDQFTRQDYIQALFDGDRCIALTCIRKVNMLSPIDREDSWLGVWPDSAHEQMAKQNDQAIINSYFSVHPDYRKRFFQDNIHPSYIMGCLSVLHQVENRHELHLGMMRNSRSMNTLGKLWGCDTLDTIEHNNEPTDVIVFKIPRVLKASESFPDVVFKLFKNRTDLTNEEEYYERRKFVA